MFDYILRSDRWVESDLGLAEPWKVNFNCMVDGAVAEDIFAIGHPMDSSENIHLIDVFKLYSSEVVSYGIVLTIAEASREWINFPRKQLFQSFHCRRLDQI